VTRLSLAIIKKEGRVWVILQVLQRLNNTRQWDEDDTLLAPNGTLIVMLTLERRVSVLFQTKDCVLGYEITSSFLAATLVRPITITASLNFMSADTDDLCRMT
jgi:hypothetical protein